MNFQGVQVGCGPAVYGQVEVRCRLHDDLESGLSLCCERLCGEGDHSVFRAKRAGDKRCRAVGRVLKADYKLVCDVVSMKTPGFAYLHADLLPGFRRFANGAALGVRAFGTGFCYVILVRPEFRLRVARVLGPLPKLEDLLVLLRASGRFKISVQFRDVMPGILHCEEAGIERSGAVVVKELLGLLEMNPNYRIGASYGTIPGPKVKCDVCGFVVKAEGHAERCRLPRTRRPISELIGDAMHSLDVKLCMALSRSPGVHHTELAKKYLSAVGQKKYLLTQTGVRLDNKASDHTWGSEFETRYAGFFRYNYLEWLSVEEDVPFDMLLENVLMPEVAMKYDGLVDGSFAISYIEREDDSMVSYLTHALTVVAVIVVFAVLLAVFTYGAN